VSQAKPEPVSTAPSVETLREVARYRGLAFSEEQLETAAESYAAFWPKLERLRAVRLEYLPPTIEPAHALAWIRNGGRAS
jgi:Asp-tRNA(Asn)/Glu-tRNA(Gln) amidotransferase C subunit